jgi:hypothetical protein
MMTAEYHRGTSSQQDVGGGRGSGEAQTQSNRRARHAAWLQPQKARRMVRTADHSASNFKATVALRVVAVVLG